jgi:hypothetical protein
MVLMLRLESQTQVQLVLVHRRTKMALLPVLLRRKLELGSQTQVLEQHQMQVQVPEIRKQMA